MLLFYAITIFVLATYGISWIITQSHLTKGFRNTLWNIHWRFGEGKILGFFTEKLAYLFQCIVCIGTWIGIGLSLIIPNTFLEGMFPPVTTIEDMILIAGLSASSIWMLSTKFDPNHDDI